MRRSYHCLHHLLPPLRTVDNLRVRGHPYNLPDCRSQKVICCPFFVWFYITFTCCCFIQFRSLCVYSSLVIVFLCFVIVLFLIAMSCHCPVCVRLSHSIKDYLLKIAITRQHQNIAHSCICVRSSNIALWYQSIQIVSFFTNYFQTNTRNTHSRGV